MTKLNVIQAPSGRFTYVGRVPIELAYPGATDDDVVAIQRSGPGIARAIARKEGRELREAAFATRAEAVAAAEAAGFQVFNA